MEELAQQIDGNLLAAIIWIGVLVNVGLPIWLKIKGGEQVTFKDLENAAESIKQHVEGRTGYAADSVSRVVVAHSAMRAADVSMTELAESGPTADELLTAIELVYTKIHDIERLLQQKGKIDSGSV